MLPSERGGEGRRERESKNKQTCLMCFLKKKRERGSRRRRERH
jgi:hypothetical protein